MPIKTVFLTCTDDDQELECFVNTKNNLFVRIGSSDRNDLNFGVVELNREDTRMLIDYLTELEKEMQDD